MRLDLATTPFDTSWDGGLLVVIVGVVSVAILLFLLFSWGCGCCGSSSDKQQEPNYQQADQYRHHNRGPTRTPPPRMMSVASTDPRYKTLRVEQSFTESVAVVRKTPPPPSQRLLDDKARFDEPPRSPPRSPHREPPRSHEPESSPRPRRSHDYESSPRRPRHHESPNRDSPRSPPQSPQRHHRRDHRVPSEWHGRNGNQEMERLNDRGAANRTNLIAKEKQDPVVDSKVQREQERREQRERDRAWAHKHRHPTQIMPSHQDPSEWRRSTETSGDQFTEDPRRKASNATFVPSVGSGSGSNRSQDGIGVGLRTMGQGGMAPSIDQSKAQTTATTLGGPGAVGKSHIV